MSRKGLSLTVPLQLSDRGPSTALTLCLKAVIRGAKGPATSCLLGCCSR